MTRRERYLGALVGLAACDALGTAVEFQRPGTFQPLTDMVGGGAFRLPAGCWTDDTSMALCLAESLLESDGFDAADQMRRYVRWYREGHLSSTGACFDIGTTTRAALERFERTGQAFADEDSQGAGNGCIMRLAPVPMFFAAEPARALALSGESARTTHGAREAFDAARYFAGLLVGALGGASREALLSPRYSPAPGAWEREPLSPRIDEIARGSFLRREPPAIRGGGYVAECLEAALWAFARSANFREGALLAVNLGDDADTTGAVYGQIAGAFYGVEAIPAGWREKLAFATLIDDMALALYRRAWREEAPST